MFLKSKVNKNLELAKLSWCAILNVCQAENKVAGKKVITR